MPIKKERKSGFLAVFLGIAVFLIFLGGMFWSMPTGKIGRWLYRMVPLPVALVDKTMVITSGELLADTEAVKKFYTSQDFSAVGMRVDFNTPEGKMRLRIKQKGVLDKLIEDAIVQRLAEERNIKITAREARAELENKIAQGGDKQALKLNLQRLYGWSVADFVEKVVEPQIRLRKLSRYYFDNEGKNDEGFAKIKEARLALSQDGSNFAQVAEKYSEGDSASAGGELGWFNREQLVPEVANEVFLLEKGEITDIIQSSLGYHIVQVQDFREVDAEDSGKQSVGGANGEPGGEAKGDKVKEIKIRQIFVRGGGFISWLAEQKKRFDVWILTREYKWDREKTKVIFHDSRLNKLEESLRIKSEGDPSMQ